MRRRTAFQGMEKYELKCDLMSPRVTAELRPCRGMQTVLAGCVLTAGPASLTGKGSSGAADGEPGQ